MFGSATATLSSVSLTQLVCDHQSRSLLLRRRTKHVAIGITSIAQVVADEKTPGGVVLRRADDDASAAGTALACAIPHDRVEFLYALQAVERVRQDARLYATGVSALSSLVLGARRAWCSVGVVTLSAAVVAFFLLLLFILLLLLPLLGLTALDAVAKALAPSVDSPSGAASPIGLIRVSSPGVYGSLSNGASPKSVSSRNGVGAGVGAAGSATSPLAGKAPSPKKKAEPVAKAASSSRLAAVPAVKSPDIFANMTPQRSASPSSMNPMALRATVAGASTMSGSNGAAAGNKDELATRYMPFVSPMFKQRQPGAAATASSGPVKAKRVVSIGNDGFAVDMLAVSLLFEVPAVAAEGAESKAVGGGGGGGGGDAAQSPSSSSGGAGGAVEAPPAVPTAPKDAPSERKTEPPLLEGGSDDSSSEASATAPEAAPTSDSASETKEEGDKGSDDSGSEAGSDGDSEQLGEVCARCVAAAFSCVPDVCACCCRMVTLVDQRTSGERRSL
jgi:hypothetical protein